MRRPILTVDDESQVRRLIEEILSLEGVQIVEARDGMNAFTSIQDLVTGRAALPVSPHADGLLRSMDRSAVAPLDLVGAACRTDPRHLMRQIEKEAPKSNR